jgi:hypothetical protein
MYYKSPLQTGYKVEFTSNSFLFHKSGYLKMQTMQNLNWEVFKCKSY